MKHHILTVSGTYFDFESPEKSTYTIEDIGHALSNIARFTGHTSKFYSVGQHCVMGSYLIDKEYALDFLLHDSAEGFLGDVSTPLKCLLPDYKAIEQNVERAIFKKFGRDFPMNPAVKEIDLVMLCTEKRDLMPASGVQWEMLRNVQPMKKVIRPWTPEKAKRKFLERYYELTNK